MTVWQRKARRCGSLRCGRRWLPDRPGGTAKWPGAALLPVVAGILAVAASGCAGRLARFDYEEPAAAPAPAQQTVPAGPTGAPLSQPGNPLSRDQLLAFIHWRNDKLDVPSADHLADLIIADSQAANLDDRLVAAVVAVESSFNATARSSTGAEGLGQLMPDTARQLGVNDPYDPDQNLQGTVRYLAWLLALWNGRADLALASYSTGLNTVRHQIASGQSLGPAQLRYVQLVRGMYQRLL